MSQPTLLPFQGVRYDPQKTDLSKVTAPPYDVISPEGQKALYEKDPHNVVRLILGYQFPTDNDQNNRYTRAAQDFESWIKEGVLTRDTEPCFYLYEQIFEWKGQGPFARRGFLSRRRVEDFGKGRVLPHEKTLSAPKADRLLLTKACGANFSPIFGLYADPEKTIAALMDRYFNEKPLVDFVGKEGTRERLWKVSDPTLFAQVDRIMAEKDLFIADGHHRYETAIAYRNWMKEKNPNSPEDAAFNYVLMFLSDMSDPGLLILPTHRVIHDVPGFEAASFKKSLKELFSFQSFSPQQKPEFLKALMSVNAETHAMGVVLPGDPEWHVISIPASKLDTLTSLGSRSPASRRVETVILHQLILGDILKMPEPDQKDPRFIEFVKDAEEALKMVNNPGVNAVFITNPTPMTTLQKVVEAGEVLPPKTTFFYPKLLTGLVINKID